MHGQSPEHYLEVLFRAQDRAAAEINDARRKLWLATVRDIETIFADHPAEIAEARDRLARSADPEARRMFAYFHALTRFYESADQQAKAAIERARRT